MGKELSNWAGNYTYGAARLHYPTTVEQLRKVVSGARKVRALGSRHSFNDIADSAGDLVSLEHLGAVLEIDAGSGTVTVGGGEKYGYISEQIHAAGYALRNLASLPHISVAGACSTATHGSGVANGNLASSVSAIQLVSAGGELVELSRDRDGDQFCGAVVALGGLGVITKVALDIVPTFNMVQNVFEDAPFAEVAESFDEVMASAYSVSLFTDWASDRIDQIWLKRLIIDGETSNPPRDFFGGTAAPANRHPIRTISPQACTEQMGVPGPWYERLPHFRMEFTPSAGDELQTEYLVPHQCAVDAIRSVRALGHLIAPLLQVSEIRTVAADDLWMSPCYEQSCVGIHFTWKKNWGAVRRLLPVIEETLEPFHARPHWGKLFTMEPERVQSLYPRLPDFQRLLLSFDPHGKFRNRFLDRYVFGS